MADTDRFNASLSPILPCVFFFNDTTTTEIYTLSLHDALPICFPGKVLFAVPAGGVGRQLLLRETPHCLPYFFVLHLVGTNVGQGVVGEQAPLLAVAPGDAVDAAPAHFEDLGGAIHVLALGGGKERGAEL